MYHEILKVTSLGANSKDVAPSHPSPYHTCVCTETACAEEALQSCVVHHLNS